MPQGEGAHIQTRAALQQKPLPLSTQPCPKSEGEPDTPNSRMHACRHPAWLIPGSTLYMHMSCVWFMSVEVRPGPAVTVLCIRVMVSAYYVNMPQWDVLKPDVNFALWV